MSERPPEGRPDNGADTPDSQGGTLEELVDRLEAGALSLDEQRRLAGFLAAESPELVMAATRHESYSGPLPHPDLLNRFDDVTRRAIVQMAVDEQAHAHRMRERGLEGAIAKDRRGQRYGLVIAVAGLAAAVAIAPFSAVAAGIIGTLDLFGFSRQNMRKLVQTHRDSFPLPLHEGRSALWHLADVLEWFAREAPGSRARCGSRPRPLLSV